MTMRRRALLIGSSTLAGIAALPDARAQAGAARSVSFVPAEALDAEERARHEGYMKLALDALEGAPAGSFAALIVDRQSGEIVCQGVGQHDENPILHGEIVALNACARLRPKVEWRDLALYTTAEPCPMCMSAIVWTRIPEVVYGTSVDELTRLGANQFRLDSVTVAAAAPFYSGRIVSGVLRQRSDPIYREWAARFR
jgi:tRNA(Arg) A34 adenosine deaminase TadA